MSILSVCIETFYSSVMRKQQKQWQTFYMPGELATNTKGKFTTAKKRFQQIKLDYTNI